MNHKLIHAIKSHAGNPSHHNDHKRPIECSEPSIMNAIAIVNPFFIVFHHQVPTTSKNPFAKESKKLKYKSGNAKPNPPNQTPPPYSSINEESDFREKAERERVQISQRSKIRKWCNNIRQESKEVSSRSKCKQLVPGGA
jgi:hypothetical protein